MHVLRAVVCVTALAIALSAGAPVAAQERAYVQFSDPLLAGDSQDPDQLNWIEAFSVAGGIDISLVAGGGSEPTREISPVVFTKPLDRSSFGLMHRLLSGGPLSVLIDVCDAPGPDCAFELSWSCRKCRSRRSSSAGEERPPAAPGAGCRPAQRIAECP